MKITKIISCSAGLDGLHLEVEVERRVDSPIVLPPATITIPLSQMESLLGAVSLAMTARETLTKAAVQVCDRPVCPYCCSNQFRSIDSPTCNAECIHCGRGFLFSVGVNGPQGVDPTGTTLGRNHE